MEKRFLIVCKKCKWSERSTGLSSDLSHLREIKKCQNCGGRAFKCPKCSGTAKMLRIKGNS
jgi:primosomal protein N'